MTSNNNNNTNSNRSLFLYTGLIFVVAIIMIIISFFAQSNVQKNQPIQSDAATTASITEKAAQLSEDNRLLLEQNTILMAENESLKQKNEELTAQSEILSKETTNNNTLLEVYRLLYNWKKTKSRELLSTIVVEDLTEQQKIFYDILVKKTK